MKCKQVQEMLPLFAGRDLEENRAKLVTAHLQSCGVCSRAAQEYGEAGQLLQMFEPPQFSEAMYTGIRQRVLREIDRKSVTPTMFESISSLFRPPLRLAVAASLLLAVSVLALYFVINRNGGRQNQTVVVETGGSGQRKTPDLQASPEPRPENLATTANPKRSATDLTTFSSRSRKSRFRPSQKRTGATNAELVATRSVDPPQPNISLKSPDTPAEALRMEMQTQDRNIRIIWFSQPTKEGSPSESSKGI